MSKNLINNIKSIINNKVHIHHFHINGGIIDYAHSYCNEKVRENKSEIREIFLRYINFIHTLRKT